MSITQRSNKNTIMDRHELVTDELKHRPQRPQLYDGKKQLTHPITLVNQVKVLV